MIGKFIFNCVFGTTLLLLCIYFYIYTCLTIFKGRKGCGRDWINKCLPHLNARSGTPVKEIKAPAFIRVNMVIFCQYFYLLYKQVQNVTAIIMDTLTV